MLDSDKRSAAELLSDDERHKLAKLLDVTRWQRQVPRREPYVPQPGQIRARRSAQDSQHRIEAAEAKRQRRRDRNLLSLMGRSQDQDYYG